MKYQESWTKQANSPKGLHHKKRGERERAKKNESIFQRRESTEMMIQIYRDVSLLN